MDNKAVRKIVVVGGGSAGWLMACRLASRYKIDASSIEITLVESPNVSTVGVGEGSWPTMRQTLKKIGISETEFMRCCGVSLKQGTCFRGWFHGGESDVYHHPFELPKWHDESCLSEDWACFLKTDKPRFCDAVSVQPAVCEENRAPKQLKSAEYQGILNYGYHLDATAFADMLKSHATKKLGVNHVLGHIEQVETDEEGFVECLKLKENLVLSGDIFFDCSGFSSLLIHKHLGIDFIDVNDQLFVDKALAVQVPYSHENSPIASSTLSTAHDAGWVWDIALKERRGVGCVYSSQHMSESEAVKVLAGYIEADESQLDVKSLKFSARYLEKFWHKNVVAVGLSSGFVEPLEASALVLVELAADWFCQRFPAHFGNMDVLSKRYNQTFLEHWQSIVDFLKLHYVLSRRTETFWLDNRDASTIPDSLLHRLELWRHCAPSPADPDSLSSIFSWQSYLYIYNGMTSHAQRLGISELPGIGVSDAQASLIETSLSTTEKMKSKALGFLPTNRDLLTQLQTVAMTKI